MMSEGHLKGIIFCCSFVAWVIIASLIGHYISGLAFLLFVLVCVSVGGYVAYVKLQWKKFRS